MRGVVVFALASMLGCFLLVAVRAAADEVDDLSATLTSGSWAKDLGNPKMPERYVYTFAKDGTYKSVLFTDFTPAPTTTGRWQLVKDKDNKVRLRLKNEGGKYPWLAKDSVIRHDKEKDVLRVSGPQYDGEQPMRHEKAAPARAPDKDAPPAGPIQAKLKVKKAEKEVKAKLAGIWKVESAEMDGKELGDRIKSTKWAITDKSFTAALPQDGKGEFAYKLGEADERGTIDIEVLRAERLGGPRKRVYPGIYLLEGDTLKVCYALDGKERPTAFASTPSSGDLTSSGGTLFVLKREPAGKKEKR
jgi:uncharacterized protein (TIGR03067 family)